MGKTMFCPVCGQETTHYKLEKDTPVFSRQERLAIDKKTRDRILKIFDNRDAFTGGSISSVAEIDHKVPWTRLEVDLDARGFTDEEIRTHFQLLTREHNLLRIEHVLSVKMKMFVLLSWIFLFGIVAGLNI